MRKTLLVLFILFLLLSTCAYKVDTAYTDLCFDQLVVKAYAATERPTKEDVKAEMESKEDIKEDIFEEENDISFEGEPEVMPENPPTHIHTFTQSTVEPTCTQDGYIQHLCECGEATMTSIEALGHDYGEWETTQNATPDADGIKTKTCARCAATETDNVVFKFKGDNAVYIQSANIHANFQIAAFTQAAIDKFDVVYSLVAYVDDPFILGHRTGSMRTLYDTEIGDIIYVNKQGTLIRYQVFVSEYARQDEAHTTIVGQETGSTIWDTFDNEVLRLYTCYGTVENDRWIVLAERLP